MGVLTLRGVIPPGRRVAARRAAAMAVAPPLGPITPGRRAGGRRPGSPQAGDDANRGIFPPDTPAERRPAATGALIGDTPPAQCGSGRRGALSRLLPAWPGLHPREEPYTYHPVNLTVRCMRTGCCL